MRIKSPVWKVTVFESDRFSGQKVLEVISYDNEQEALDYADTYNSKNTSKEAPEYYIAAKVDKVA